MASQGADLVRLSDTIKELVVKDKNGQPVVTPGTSALDGKTVALYFSAHWCPPCRGFTPRLRAVYNELQSQGKPFEVVFVSSDSSQKEFDEYFAEMPWTAVPFSASGARAALGRQFNVMGIPALAVVGPDGRILSRNARSAVLSGGAQAFPWEGQEESSSGGGIMGIIRSIVMVMLVWAVMRFLTQGTAGFFKKA